MNRSATVVACLFLLLGNRLPAAAQGDQTGVIRGTVSDSQRLPLPGVTVSATSPALQLPRTTVTEANGTYVLPLLPAGVYTVKYEISQFRTVETETTVPVGGAIVQNAVLAPGAEAEVVVTKAAELSTTEGDFSITQRTVDALPTGRTLHGIATLSPALSENTPNARQVTINGAFSFDNVFMIDGVDVNDNLLGTPQNLFIEDAIAETQVLTSGIPAEYGRFSGGVINAITKSGGNRFSGSARLNLANPSWTAETPFEVARGTEYIDTLNETYEGTFGGPVVRDRVWFFAAGRRENVRTTQSLNATGFPYLFADKNWRAQGKLTASPVAGQTVNVGYVNNSRTTTERKTVAIAVETRTLDSVKEPNWYLFGNYRGVLGTRAYVEGQVSERRYKVEGLGGSSPAIRDSPFVGVGQGGGDAFYNAPNFDETDPESRNNRQMTGTLTYVFQGAGQHELKGGYDWYRSQRRGGNSQTSTGYIFVTPYLEDLDGNPVLDASGRVIPDFGPETFLENWIPLRGAVLNIDTHSFFAQDHWRVTPRLSADLGFRVEKVRSEATGGIIGVDTHAIVPRLGVAYDVKGDGALVVASTYSHYSGRYNEQQIGRNSNVGNADNLQYFYDGPPGQGFDFAPAYDIANYQLFDGFFPTANVSVAEDLHTPITREFTLSLGAGVGRRGYVEALYVRRNVTGVIEDFETLQTGETDVIQDGGVLTTLTNVEFRNTDDMVRRYQGLVFQGRYRLNRNWSAQGAWTVQLKNEGNYVGEAPNNPGAPSLFGDYPEALTENRNYPVGRLQLFQRHRLRLWTIYDLDLERFGTFSFSGLWRYDSGRAYSLAIENWPLSGLQQNLLSGYATIPSTQELYFAGRGTETFPGYGLVDLAVNYAVPVLRQLSPWAKVEVFNLLNNQDLVRFNTQVLPALPADALGLPANFVRASSFGQPLGPGSYPGWAPGETGGRTFRMSVGIRF